MSYGGILGQRLYIIFDIYCQNILLSIATHTYNPSFLGDWGRKTKFEASPGSTGRHHSKHKCISSKLMTVSPPLTAGNLIWLLVATSCLAMIWCSLWFCQHSPGLWYSGTGLPIPAFISHRIEGVFLLSSDQLEKVLLLREIWKTCPTACLSLTPSNSHSPLLQV